VELAEVEGGLLPGLPAGAGRQRSDQVDIVGGAGGQDVVDAHVASVDQMLVRQQIDRGQIGVAGTDGVDVGGRGHGRGHVHDQVGRSGSQVSVRWAL
jgi:hypothetical protein